MMTWRAAYLKQAWSDFKLYKDLMLKKASFCHQLHYLQMATEKMAKGFQCSPRGGPYPKTHIVFVKFLQSIKQNPIVYYKKLNFKKKDQFVSHIKSLLPTADLIENLAPTGGNYDKVNPEYPWTDKTNIFCPVLYGFPEFRKKQRELLQMQKLLTNLFGMEGYS